MPASNTRTLNAIKNLGSARKSMNELKSESAAIKIKANFDINKLGQEEQYQQDFFGYGQDMLQIASTGASLYEDYLTMEEGRDILGKKSYDAEKDAKIKEYEDDPHRTLLPNAISDWEDLSMEDKQKYMPQKEYDYDIGSKWGKIRKVFDDMGSYTGDIDSTYTFEGNPIKTSSIKAVQEIKQSEDLKKLLGIDSGLTSSRPSLPTDSLTKIQTDATSYIGTDSQNQDLLIKMGGKKGGSLHRFLMEQGEDWTPQAVKNLYKEHME